jgi:hypothetical protein
MCGCKEHDAAERFCREYGCGGIGYDEVVAFIDSQASVTNRTHLRMTDGRASLPSVAVGRW